MNKKEEFLICKNNELNVNRIIKITKAEGPGNRFCIWVQGCSRHCQGCFAKDTWDFVPKQVYEVNDIVDMIKAQEEIEGITIIGGEPFEQAEAVAKLTTEIRKLGLTIMLFTGYKHCDIEASKDVNWHIILGNLDVLIDGEYIDNERCFDVPFIGSTNQEILFLSDRYNINDFKKSFIEIRINKKGEALYNGMGDFNQIKSNFKE